MRSLLPDTTRRRGRGIHFFSLIVLGAVFAGFPGVGPGAVPLAAQSAGTDYPRAPREFRGVWVTTLKNLDWPSRPGLSAERQREELVAILDRAVELNLNAVILQVRSMGEALYASENAPWSHFLSGEMGRPPGPAYDPLEFAIQEARRRGLELHAWLNPYRVHHEIGTDEVSSGHISRTHPQLVRRYGSLLWLDPSEPEVRRHILAVVREIVRNYDVDGIHIDDYFYPWPQAGRPFPDDANWERYRRGGGDLSRADWRRRHVNELIHGLYAEVKRENPRVKVGVSPFGIWRPNHPAGITGSDQYEMLYADPRLWLRRGWLDYIAPQLYWSTAQEQQSFPRLLAWWHAQNTRDRHVWPGLATWKVTEADWSANEIVNQIETARRQGGTAGHIHFRHTWLHENRAEIATTLRSRAYPSPALVPASPWLGDEAPARPKARLGEGASEAERVVRFESPETDEVRLWALYTRHRDGWHFRQILPAYRRHTGAVRIPAAERGVSHVAITAVDRLGNESDPAVVRVR